MRDWLAEVSGVLNRPAAVQETVRFELSCPCGQTVEGARAQDVQRVPCSSCGEVFFVLPANVYPPPQRGRVGIGRPRRQREHNSQALTIAASKVRAVLYGATVGPILRLVAGLRCLWRGFLALFTPFRVVMWCLVAVVAATGYWLYWSRTRDRAELTLQQSLEGSQVAWKQGDFLAAEKALQAAVDALDLLGRQDTLARLTRQQLKEARAASHLIPESLFEMVRLAQELDAQNPSVWQERMKRDFLDTWVVMQTRVMRQLDADGSVRFAVDYPLSVDSRSVTLDADLDILQRLDWSQTRSGSSTDAENRDWRTAIFAAQLADCVREADGWVIRFKPDTAFLWTAYDSFCALGFRPEGPESEEEIRQILAAQAETVGTVP